VYFKPLYTSSLGMPIHTNFMGDGGKQGGNEGGTKEDIGGGTDVDSEEGMGD